MRIIIWTLVALAAFGTAAFVLSETRINPSVRDPIVPRGGNEEVVPPESISPDNRNEEIACTMEAKICPDGTAVGRQGPKCEFAPCPGVDSTPQTPEDPIPSKTSEISREIGLGETAEVLGISITPLRVIEDSRCPIDAMCIWQGRLRIEARIVSGMGATIMTLEQQMSITTEAEEITLMSATPAPQSEKPADPSAYRFTFEVRSRTSSI